jgi:hypothetical protein
MSRSASAPFDWPGWRADVVARLDRRSIIAGLAFAVVWSALNFVGHRNEWGDAVVRVAMLTLFMLSAAMVTLAVLAVALVAVARGISVWLAYPVAGVAVVALGLVIGLVIDPFSWFAKTPPKHLHAMIVGYLFALSFLVPPAVLYVYASSARYDQKVLRAVEAERAAEAERLARQRLEIELATVDHDLVLKAMRQALNARAHEAAQAQALLEAVTAYLRVAQQRGSSEPGRIAAALAELRQACAIRAGEPAQHLIA